MAVSKRNYVQEQLVHTALDKYAHALELRVAERPRQLADALARAESAVRAKDDVLANMSHEIRTTLNCMLGMANLALSGVPTQPERSYLDQITRAGNRGVSIVSEILDFCKMDAGKLEIERLP